MSLTFSLSGNTSELSSVYFPPIELDRNGVYALGLIGLRTYYSIPNVSEKNNKFYYTLTSDGAEQSITIPVGSYELQDIQAYINQYFEDLWRDNRVNDIKKMEQMGPVPIIHFKPNHNTLKCNLYSDSLTVIFKSNGLASLLGFEEGTYAAGQVHESTLPVNITNVNSVHVTCNITTGSYYNGIESHTLYEFGIDVEPGYKIIESPQNIVYMPINSHTISNITLRLLDQSGNLIDFRGETIDITLELKRLW